MDGAGRWKVAAGRGFGIRQRKHNAAWLLQRTSFSNHRRDHHDPCAILLPGGPELAGCNGPEHGKGRTDPNQHRAVKHFKVRIKMVFNSVRSAGPGRGNAAGTGLTPRISKRDEHVGNTEVQA